MGMYHSRRPARTLFYTYTVFSDGWERETIDIYARSAGCNGVRGLVFDPRKTDPEGWADSQRVKLAHYTDAVIYELHVRDFSADPCAVSGTRASFLRSPRRA